MNGYEVVSPHGERATQAIAATPRFETLDGKRVAFVWDEVFRGDEMFAVLRDDLRRRWPLVEFVGHEHFGSPEGRDGHAVVAALPRRLADQRVDAVIAGVGA
jgi:hypothetical protein